MANFQAKLRYMTIILALNIFLAVAFIEGRKLRSINQQRTIASFKDDLRPTNPGHSPGMGHSSSEEEKALPLAHAGGQTFKVYKDSKSTQPLYTYGIGHALAASNKEEKTEEKTLTKQGISPSHGTGIVHFSTEDTVAKPEQSWGSPAFRFGPDEPKA